MHKAASRCPFAYAAGAFSCEDFPLEKGRAEAEVFGDLLSWEGSVSLCTCRTEELGLGEHRWTPGLWKVPFKPALFKFLG